MQVTVTGRHFEVRPALRSYLDVRLERLLRYIGKIESAHVMLSAQKSQHRAEIVLHAAGKEFTSRAVSDDMYAAVDSVVDKVEKQLRRFKDRRMTARKNGVKAAANGDAKLGTLRVLRADTVGNGTLQHDLLEALDYPLIDLTVDEAIAQLQKSGDPFVVFLHQASADLHVVYLRPDGNFGVLNLHATA
jgi:putative sigma-54 modulation protein